MMFKQVKDILDIIKKFYEQLNQYYKNLAQKSEKEKVKVLLDYVHKNQNNLIDVIEKYKDEGNEKLLNTWIRHTPNSQFHSDIEKMQMSKSMSVDDVLEVIVHFNAWLENFFTCIIETSKSTEVQNTFSTLLNNLKNEKLNIVKNSKILNDM